MNKKILFLQIGFWAGAIFDAIMVPLFLFPKLASFILGIDNSNPDITTRYIMNVGAALMAGWTVLLIWAALKPIERKGIVLLTLFPLAGIIGSGISLYISNGIQLDKILPIWIGQGILFIIYCFNYFNTKSIKYN
ncbi:MAG: hypothetical protein A2086_14245 [Spirochaetes bacterium GWD1_27_9]|nr:MAG: hypothetical protein A2Z98_09275 [Spirochaetes bacterium GWB1_27_13]OHD23672.1 MAG: hypothetical protein A2Y34_15415 [Spirochaetes bacterium GWC1_27_15]OHD29885.1 MAG: hypothetical protein A2086_14245 [Spirochaetes bacterium GWD1_27_9]